jgi:hypothetical protein
MVGVATARAKHIDGNRHDRTHHRPAAMPRGSAGAQPPAAGQLSTANQEDAAGPGGLPQRRNWGACGVGHWGANCKR